jgi:uncharacterized OB-fold protein
MSRIIGVDTEDLYVGMPIRAKFRRNLKLNPTDVYFVPKA